MSDNQRPLVEPDSDDQQPTTDRRPTDQPMLVSVKDAAVRLGISENAVRLRIKRNTLPAEKIGDNWFVVVGDQRPTTSNNQQPTTTHQLRPTTSDQSSTDQSVVVAERIRVELESVRDEWLQPLIDQIRELERDRGRLEAERDQARQSAEAAIAARDQLQEERDELISVRESLRGRLSALEEAKAESPAQASSAPETATDAATDALRKPRQRRWWLRLFGVDE